VGAVVAAVQYDATDTPSTVAEATTNLDGMYELGGLTSDASVDLYTWDPDQYRNTSGYVDVLEPSSGVIADDLQLASDSGVGAVRIQGFVEASGLPTSGYTAVLRIKGTPFRLPLTLDAAGETVVHGLPGGNPIDVSIDGAAGHGREYGQTLSLDTVTVQVAVDADRIDVPIDLSQFRYHGTALGEAPTPYSLGSVSPWAALGDGTEPWDEPASTRVSASGREFSNTFRTAFQSGQTSPLRLVRRVYIPPDGRFARVVDTLENVGTEAAAGQYNFDNYFFLPYSWTEILGDGSIDASDAGFVLMSGDATAAYGIAFRGGSTPEPSVALPSLNSSQIIWNNFSLDPGEKKSFMTFIALGRDANAATVLTRIQALLNLSDPLALEGLSASDRALIVNWILQ
jgi:hypothetical protein